MRWVLALISIGVALPAAAQPPRDIQRSVASGRARITGTIVTADVRQSKPLRRARVMLTGGDLPVGRTVITNDDGTFAFDAVPAGRYGVSASKDAYVPMIFGATRSGRPGTSVVVRDGETRTIRIGLPRGAVITGAITGADNQPATGTFVTAMAYRFNPGGERRLAPVGQGGQTDDRGEYRIFGLPAGEYVVVAQVRAPGGGGELQVISESEVRRALAALRETSVSRTRPGIIVPPAVIFDPEPRRGLAFAPVFYPGTAVAARAIPITVGIAEERHAVDFQLEYVPTARVSGTVSDTASVLLFPSGPPQPFDTVRSATADAHGTFTFSAVPPGQYTLMARQFPQGRSAGPIVPGTAPSMVRVATTDVVVDGDDVDGVSLALQPGLTISGRAGFEGTRPPPPDLPGLRLPVPATLSLSNISMPMPPLQLDGDGRFTISGVVPGLYRLGNAVQGLRSSVGGWWLKSIVINDRDILDRPIELRQNATDAVITFSDSASELAGRISDARDEPAPDYFVIAFSADRSAWFLNSRRIAVVKPDRQGRYSIRNLPPGGYFVVAYADVEFGEWWDPAVLERLETAAMRIAMGPMEKKTYDIRVK